MRGRHFILEDKLNFIRIFRSKDSLLVLNNVITLNFADALPCSIFCEKSKEEKRQVMHFPQLKEYGNRAMKCNLWKCWINSMTPRTIRKCFMKKEWNCQTHNKMKCEKNGRHCQSTLHKHNEVDILFSDKRYSLIL